MLSRCVGNGVVGMSSSISMVFESLEMLTFFVAFSVGSGEMDTLNSDDEEYSN